MQNAEFRVTPSPFVPSSLRPFVPLCNALLAALASAAPINVNDPPPGRFVDQWLEIYMGGDKVGYGHSTMTRLQDRIHAAMEFTIRIARVDMAVEISVARRTTETIDARPLTFATEMKAATMKTTTAGRVEDGKVTITTSQFGMEQRQTYDYPKGSLMDWGLFRESIVRGFKPGTEYTVETYSPELRLDAAVPATTKVGEWEEFKHADRTMRGQKVTVTLNTHMGPMEMISWVDEDGNMIKSRVPMAGVGDMVMIAADEKTALADFIPPELFMTNTIKANRKIDADSADRITYRVSLKQPPDDEADELSLPDTDMQKATKRTDGSLEVTVTRQTHQRPDGYSSDDLSPADRREYLGANLNINTDDPELIKLAKKAAGGERDPYKLADRLRQFVTDYVEEKNLTIAFATASEVARNKEGDCSEHGVLLAALGRINDLPSRVAVGLAYVPVFGRQDDIFGYHMWTQFYVDGRWLDVDAALRETSCSPTRIAFATSSLQNTGLADLSLPLLNKLGAIQVEIREIK
jgi:hypothetical protein